MIIKLLQPESHLVFLLDKGDEAYVTVESDGGDVGAFIVDEANLALHGASQDFVLIGDDAPASEHEIVADLEPEKQYHLVVRNDNSTPVAVGIDFFDEEEDDEEDEDDDEEDEEDDDEEENAGG